MPAGDWIRNYRIKVSCTPWVSKFSCGIEQTPGIPRTKNKAPHRCEALVQLAEREGFEPSVRLHVRLISSQVHSTTLPPLQRGARGPREPASLRGRWARDKLPRGLPVSRAAVSRPFSSPIAARYRPRYPGSAIAIRCPVPSATRPDPDGRWGPGRRCRCTCPWRERS